jgi:hypothetical protein
MRAALVQGILFPVDAVVMQTHVAGAQYDLGRVMESGKRDVDAYEETTIDQGANAP